jgi:serine/threonine-protein phosphatase 6 regulatory subunit 3
MSLLNRSTEYNHLYDKEGRLQGGLSALEELAQVIAISSGEDNKHDDVPDEADETEPALELPVSNASHDANSLLDSDEDMSDDDDHEPGSSDDDESMEEIAMDDEPPIVAPRPRATSVPPPDLPPSSIHEQQLPPPLAIESPLPMSPSRRLLALSGDSDSSLTNGRRSVTNSMRSVKRYSSVTGSTPSAMPIGERLKKKFLDLNVLGTFLVSHDRV